MASGWNYKRAFIRCALLLAAGMALQIAAGDVPAAFLRYPWSAVLAVNYLYLLVLAYAFSDRYRWLGTLWDGKACVSSLSSFLLLVTVSGFHSITSSWPFVIMLFYFMTSLGIRTVSEIAGLMHLCSAAGEMRGKLRILSRTAVHAGVFILLWAGVFGSGDKVRCKVAAHAGKPAAMAASKDGKAVSLPFSLTLKQFSIDEYPPKLHIFDTGNGELSDGFLQVDSSGAETFEGKWKLRTESFLPMAGCMPGDSVYVATDHTGAAPAVFVIAENESEGIVRSGWVSCGSYIFAPLSLSLGDGKMVVMPVPEAKRYLSEVEVLDDRGRRGDFAVRVNHPARMGPWSIYQSGYDTSRGRWSTVSVLECVKDSWYWLVHVSLWLVLVSSGAMLLAFLPRRRVLLFVVLAAAVCAGVFFFGMHEKALVPALRSVWFVPHVAAYVFAYTLMTAATLAALVLWLCPLRKESLKRGMRLCDGLVRAGVAFLSAGMVMGALWAKQAWGDWWSWDPKETWAAATWLGYLLYIHFRGTRSIDCHTVFAIVVFSFLLLQMCWWGVNFLPSAQEASLHTY